MLASVEKTNETRSTKINGVRALAHGVWPREEFAFSKRPAVVYPVYPIGVF
jgi:hypothetical protein